MENLQDLPEEKDTQTEQYDTKEIEERQYLYGKQPEAPNPHKSKGKVFQAAVELFSEYGYSGTNTRAIADLAGVKLVMVHYHYQSKEKLYEEVLKYETINMLEAVFDENSEQKSPEEILLEAPLRLMEVIYKNPRWASLLRREIADGGEHLRNALKEVAQYGPLGANMQFHNAYLAAVREGKVADLPLGAVRECLLAIGYSAVLFGPLVALINERDFHEPSVWEEWKTTLSTILRKGLLTT